MYLKILFINLLLFFKIECSNEDFSAEFHHYNFELIE